MTPPEETLKAVRRALTTRHEFSAWQFVLWLALYFAMGAAFTSDWFWGAFNV